jgi:hypothetical protein
MASSIETTSTTTTLKNNGNTYLSVDTDDIVALTNPLPLASGGTGGTTSATAAAILAPIQLQTAVATTSGTSIDFTSIPSGVKRISVLLNGVSSSGTSIVQVQLGTSSTAVTTGYLAMMANIQSASNTTRGVISTTGFPLDHAGVAASLRHGKITFDNVSGNIWVGSGNVYMSGSSWMNNQAGKIDVGGVLDMVRLTTVNGSDTFDAGSVNISWEF